MVSFDDFSLPLVIDASSTTIQMGIPEQNDWLILEESNSLAMQGIFETCHQIFKNIDRNLREVDALLYCAGPGSTLGLRIAATFCRTILWNSNAQVKLFDYNALDLAALIVNQPERTIQAPFRAKRRLVRLPTDSPFGKIEIIEAEDTATAYPDSLHLPDNRPFKQEIPQDRLIDYKLTNIAGLSDLQKICTAKETATPFSAEQVEFKKWDGKITARK